MAFLKAGSKIPRPVVIATHPEYGEKNAAYRLYRHCFEGSGGFAPKLHRIDKTGTELTARDYLAALEKDEEVETYLIPHEREHAEDFKDRLQQAHVPNFVKHRGILPLTGFLCDQTPDRHHPTEVEDWMDNATVEGDSFDDWKADEGIPYAWCYGSLPCIIDSDPHTATTEAERLNQGAETAKMRVVHPENILDWRLGRGGRLDSIKYKAKVELSDILGKSLVVDRYVFVTTEGWMYVDDTPEKKNQAELTVTAAGMWPWYGNSALPQRAPIVELKFNRGLSDLHDIAPVWKRMFNMLSELGSLERNQRPVFYAPDDESPDQPGSTLTVGPKNWFGVPDGATCTPGFASPDATCLNHYLEMIKLYPEWIQEIMGTASIFGAQAEAAAALAYRFDVTNKKLKKAAKALSRFEIDCAEVVMLWHGKALGDDISSEYQHSFDAVAVERLLEQTSRLSQDLGPLPPTAVMLIQKRAFEAVMQDIDEQFREALEIEWKLQVETAANDDETEPEPDEATEPGSIPRPGGEVAGAVGGER